LTPVSDSLGMDLPILKYAIAMVAVYPFSYIMYRLPNANLKHAWSIIISTLMLQWIFGPDWIHTLISSAITYAICAFWPRKTFAIIGFRWVMAYMTICHLYRMYVSYLSGVFDFTGTQMVLTMKLTAFAYNLYDGTVDAKKVFSNDHSPKELKTYLQRRRFAIAALPSPLEFFGYAFCFTSILAGPAFEYNDYINIQNEKAFLIDDKALTSKEGKKYNSPYSGKILKPSTFVPALKCLLIGLFSLFIHVKYSAIYPMADHYKEEFIAKYAIPERFLRLVLSIFFERFKYYYAWKVAEGASILSGFGFEGYTTVAKSQGGESVGEIRVNGWKGVENIDIIAVESSASMQMMTRSWNKRTQGWLERYTYSRTNKSLIATYFVSGFWHGLYPSYYFLFFTAPFLTAIERLVKEKINPLVVPEYDGFHMKTYPKTLVARIYYAICYVNTMAALHYIAQTQFMGSYERSIRSHYGYRFLGHIIFTAVYLVLLVFPSPAKKPKVPENEKKTK
jgi:lysophospholipid acyltransferase